MLITRLLSISFALSSSLAFACSCPALDFDPGVAAADVIFEGTVAADPIELSIGDFYVIHVTRVLKGDVPSRVVAVTKANGCGVFPTPGVPWVFMFHPEARWFGIYELFNCGVISHPVADLTASQMASLGSGYPPRTAPTPLTIATTILVFVLAAAVWRLRRRRTNRA